MITTIALIVGALSVISILLIINVVRLTTECNRLREVMLDKVCPAFDDHIAVYNKFVLNTVRNRALDMEVSQQDLKLFVEGMRIGTPEQQEFAVECEKTLEEIEENMKHVHTALAIEEAQYKEVTDD